MAAPRLNLNLWYRQPAREWLEALPVGNGRLGAMVFGTVAEERLQLNEETLWAGGPIDRNNPRALKALPEVRRLLFEQKPAEAEKIADAHMFGEPRQIKPYQTLGDLHLAFAGHERFSDYRRELDLDRAIARTEYRAGGALFVREVFASAPDQVIVLRVASSEPGKITCDVRLSRRADAAVEAVGADRLLMHGRIDGGQGLDYAALLHASVRGGSVRAEKDRLRIKAADELLILISAATGFRGGDPAAACRATIDRARESTFEALRDRHAADHRALFRRVDLSLGKTDPAVADLPTDERIERLKRGEADDALLALYFQFGRYLLMSSSRPGTLPANLLGLWNDSLTPPWNCDYHLNINVQMNYWPAEVCNLPECHLPALDLLESLREPGRRTAQVHYGARGFVVHLLTDIFGVTVPYGSVGWGLWPTGGAWLSDHLWEHYRFTLDRQFLERQAYPILKEAAEFFLDYLVPDSQGHLVTGPSISPENAYQLPDGTRAHLCMGPTMDLQIVRSLFDHCIESAQILRRDEDFARRVRDARDRLAPLQVGKHGQLMEWRHDYDEPEPGHRHVSHLYALHPANQIDLDKTPEFAKAARTTLERRLSHGGGHTGWSRAWIINFFARFRDGERAYHNLIELLKSQSCINLFDLHPPRIFQIDGNLGATAGIAEMLVQSHMDEIRLLPALPAAWSEGSFRGLRARGGIEIDSEWSGGKIIEIRLRPSQSGPALLRLPVGQQVREAKADDGTAVTISAGADGSIRVDLTAERGCRLVCRQ